MDLGDIIDALEPLDPTLLIQFDTGEYPDTFESWRGAYRDLTLTRYGDEYANVGYILSLAKKAVGATFEGYKGGDFLMGKNTPVWADNYGAYTKRCITGIRKLGMADVVMIDTFVIPPEYS